VLNEFSSTFLSELYKICHCYNCCVVYVTDFPTQVTISQYILVGTKVYSKKPQVRQFNYTWQALEPTYPGFCEDRS
jgi:hypothetical protein